MFNDLNDEITFQIEKIKSSFPEEKRIALIELVRCVDSVFVYSLIVTDRDDKQEVEELYDFITTGYSAALRIFFDKSVYNFGYPLFASNNESIKWANSCLINLGHIGYVERFIELQRQNIYTVKRDENDFYFICVCENPGREALGAKDYYRWQSTIKLPKSEEKILKELSPKIQEILLRETAVWETNFIRYGCTPELDEYYKILGKQYSKKLIGYDSFGDEIDFDGILFKDVKAVVEALIGYALKHKDHCLTLLKKCDYKINPWNIYPVASRIDQLIDDISCHKNLPPSKVERIINILTVSDTNVNYLLAVPGSAPPPLIRISNEHVLRSLAGLLVNPFDFVLTSLKLNYTKSFFKAVNTRENVFKNELYALFSSNSIHKSYTSISLKDQGKQVTDIDGLLYDEINKTLIIVQLKWFDDFGTAMRKRFNMKSNLYESSIKWIEVVLHWLKNNSSTELAKRIPTLKKLKFDVQKTEILILTRTSSHISGIKEDNRAIWCSWYRFLILINEKPEIKNDLTELAKYLRENSLEKEMISKLEATILQVGKYKITIDS